MLNVYLMITCQTRCTLGKFGLSGEKKPSSNLMLSFAFVQDTHYT